MIWVVLVDDQALMRAGYRALLDAEDGIEVVGEGRSRRSRPVDWATRRSPRTW